MRQLPSPPQLDFDTYINRQGIQYVEHETNEPLEHLYSRGYLPYSGAKDLKDIFYSARSARVALKDFTLSSENRRIAKKFDGTFTKTRTKGPPPRNAFAFCLAYFQHRHGTSTMPPERLEIIFAQVTHTTIYRSADSTVAYVISIEDGSFGHFWYSFYDLSLAQQSLGLWLMLDCIRDAKAAGLTHYYLGTVYGEKALYKTNFEPLEWWDGTQWSSDVQKLKELARSE